MARIAKPLTDKAIRDAIKGRGPRRLPLWDGKGLHLIARDGHLHWRLKYRRPDGRENRIALGHYPEVTLAEARALALDARAQLRRGIDPSEARKAARVAARPREVNTFAELAAHWLEIKEPGWSPVTIRKNRRAVNVYLVPAVGKLDVATIATRDVLMAVRETDSKSREYAITAAAAARGIVRLAIAEGLREEGRLLDLDLRHNLPRHERGHMAAATTPAALVEVLRTIQRLPNPVTRAALMLCCYLGQRPGNIVSMRWDQIDVQTTEWSLPAEVMKTRRPHAVPLPRQALALIEELRPLTGGIGYVFPPLARQRNVHLTRDTLSKALRDAGLRGVQTPHGLRATLRTVARERLGVHADVLEAQLAHAKRGQVQAAYDRAGHLQERHKVMQGWADYLDALRDDGR
jgi:integrase